MKGFFVSASRNSSQMIERLSDYSSRKSHPQSNCAMCSPCFHLTHPAHPTDAFHFPPAGERPGQQSQRWAHLSGVRSAWRQQRGGGWGKDGQANPVAAPRGRRSPWPTDWLVTCPKGPCPSVLCHPLHPSREFKRKWTCIPALCTRDQC